jgi:Domain of unknown function (DUF4365)
MAEDKDPWFVLERSQALAALLLTNQADVEVVFQRKTDDGADLVVGVDGRTSPPTRLFAVQVKGTVSANPSDWTPTVKQLFRAGGGRLHLPTCVFVVNVRDNTAVYAWIAEPVAESDRAKLDTHQGPTLHELDDSAVAEIVGRVKAYYDLMPNQLQTAG